MARRSWSHLVCVGLIVLLAFLFLASATGMLIQVSRTSPLQGLRNNWNALIIGVSYVLFAFISFGYFVGRTIVSKRRLAKISVSDAAHMRHFPASVQKHIETGYRRALSIAYQSSPFVESREGWGTPGTPLEGIRFRTALLDTLVPIDVLAREVLPHLATLYPHKPLLEHFSPLIPLLPSDTSKQTCLHVWTRFVEHARQSSQPLLEREFMQAMQAAGQLSRLLDEYKLDMMANATNSTVQR